MSLCTVVRVPCWSAGLAGHFFVVPVSSASGETLLGGGDWAYRAVRRSSARRAEAVIGSPRGGGHWPGPASLQRWPSEVPLGGWLWVLRDDRNGSSRPGGPGPQ